MIQVKEKILGVIVRDRVESFVFLRKVKEREQEFQGA